MICLIQSICLLPWGGVNFLTNSTPSLTWLPCLVIFSFLLVIDFYADAVAKQHSEASRLSCLSTLVPIFTSLGVSFYLGYNTPQLHHALSVGVVLAALLLLLATIFLTRTVQQSHGLLIGYSASGLPLYSSQQTISGNTNWLKPLLGQILEKSDSRRIFYFLLLNLVSIQRETILYYIVSL